MGIAHTKKITILIAGAVFIAGFMMGFGGYVFAGENYNSSKSNTSTGIINRDVGNLLIDYGYGGEVVNQVTEALARGVTTDGLRAILSGTSARSPAVVEEVLQKLEVELERLGIRFQDDKDSTQAVSAPDAGGAVPSASDGTIRDILPSKQAEPASATTPLFNPKEYTIKSINELDDGLDSETRSGGFIKLGDLPGERAAFEDSAIKSIQDLKAAESKEQRGDIIKELKYRRVLLQQGVQTLRQDLRANAQDLRENFKLELKNVRLVGYVVVAHGKGLRMINRYRSAIARFDHILGRLESRIEKIGIEGEARAKGKVKWTNPPENLVILIEEAKNAQALNKAKLVELQAKYESLLLGEKAIGYLKIDGIDGEKVFIKYDGVDGEKAFIKIEGLDGEKAMGYIKIEGLDGEKAMGYIKIEGVKGKGMFIKIEGLDGEKAFIKLGDIKGEISQGIGEEARAIAKELKSEIENLHGLLDDIKQSSVDYNSSRSNVKL